MDAAKVMKTARTHVYENVIWDWNGTLLDDIALVIEIVNEILLDHQLEPMGTDRYRELFDFPVEQYYERAGMDLAQVDFREVSARFHDAFELRVGAAKLFPRAVSTLNTIKDTGVRQFLLSSSEQNSLVQMVGGFGLNVLFDDICGIGDRLARGKTEAGRQLLDTHKIDPSRTLMVGDTSHDWEVAQACGMDCVLLSTGHQSHSRLATLGCPIFDAIDELPAWLRA